MSVEICVIGGGKVGRRITDRLEYRGDTVVIIERDSARSRALESDGYRVVHGGGTDLATMEKAGVPGADVVVVATGDDDSNLLAAQLVRNEYAPDSVIAKVNRPENEDPFGELGIRTVSRPDATAKMLDSHVESPAMTQWMETIGHEGDFQEITVRNPELVGSSVRELDAHLPAQVLLLMVGCEGKAHLPDPEEIVARDDHVTVIGPRNAVSEAMRELVREAPADEESGRSRQPQ